MDTEPDNKTDNNDSKGDSLVIVKPVGSCTDLAAQTRARAQHFLQAQGTDVNLETLFRELWGIATGPGTATGVKLDAISRLLELWNGKSGQAPGEGSVPAFSFILGDGAQVAIKIDGVLQESVENSDEYLDRKPLTRHDNGVEAHKLIRV